MHDGWLDDILARCRRGETEAFEPVVTTYRLALLGRCSRLGVSDPHAAEDIVQDVLLKAFEKWVAATPPNPVGWLYKVAYFRCCNWHRRRKQTAKRERSLDGTEQSSPDFAQEIANRAEQAELLNLISSADPQGYSRLYRVVVQGHTQAAVAAQDHVTPAAISQHLKSLGNLAKQGSRCIDPDRSSKPRSRKKGGNNK